jgi:hypothetical protein
MHGPMNVKSTLSLTLKSWNNIDLSGSEMPNSPHRKASFTAAIGLKLRKFTVMRKDMSYSTEVNL